MEKTAATRFPIHELLARRWSPRVFADRPVPSELLGSLFEAARWAPSSYNEQPWALIVATREDPEAYERLLGCLVEFNAGWARSAPVLMLSVAHLTFARNEKPNRHAYHDVGLAVQSMVVQAQAHGIAVHQMAGFDVDKARRELAIPDGWDPVAAIALGYPGDPASLNDDLRAKEAEPRSRKPLAEVAFAGRFGERYPGV